MDILRFYHSDGSYDAYCTNSWYHKPCILRELADYANKSPEYFSNKETIFVTSSKYGKQQFIPKRSECFAIKLVFPWKMLWHDLFELVILFNEPICHSEMELHEFVPASEKVMAERYWFTLQQICSDAWKDYFDEFVVNGQG